LADFQESTLVDAPCFSAFSIFWKIKKELFEINYQQKQNDCQTAKSLNKKTNTAQKIILQKKNKTAALESHAHFICTE